MEAFQLSVRSSVPGHMQHYSQCEWDACCRSLFTNPYKECVLKSALVALTVSKQNLKESLPVFFVCLFYLLLALVEASWYWKCLLTNGNASWKLK